MNFYRMMLCIRGICYGPVSVSVCLSGWVKIGYFRQITGYISKTVQDRCMVSIKVEWEVVCALSNGDIADDLECPLSAPNYPIFCI